jgi:hypothetical protein
LARRVLGHDVVGLGKQDRSEEESFVDAQGQTVERRFLPKGYRERF